jgi:hypothetical protein
MLYFLYIKKERDEMRDLFFKNHTSADNKRKIIASSETADSQGVRKTIRRHLVYIVKEIKDNQPIERPLPYIYLLKERNTKEQREKFLFKLKGSMQVLHKGRLFLILFMHTLSINLATIPSQDLINL